MEVSEHSYKHFINTWTCGATNFQNVILSLFEIVAFLSLLRFSEYSIVLKTMSENELSIVRNQSTCGKNGAKKYDSTEILEKEKYAGCDDKILKISRT